MSSVTGWMEFLELLKLKNKKATAFGCYGWSGESVKILQEMLGKAGFTGDKNLLQVRFAYLSCDTSFAVLNMEMQLQNQVGRVALNTLPPSVLSAALSFHCQFPRFEIAVYCRSSPKAFRNSAGANAFTGELANPSLSRVTITSAPHAFAAAI